MDYESLLQKADSHQLTVKEKPLKQHDGLIFGRKIAIRSDIPTTKHKACVLAEELGHYFTSTGNILTQDDVSNCKQEYRARVYGYNLSVGLLGIIKCYEHGCRTLYEMAELLNVTEEYLNEALTAYKNKYGMYTTIDNYIVYFYPNLGVVKMK